MLKRAPLDTLSFAIAIVQNVNTSEVESDDGVHIFLSMHSDKKQLISQMDLNAAKLCSCH